MSVLRRAVAGDVAGRQGRRLPARAAGAWMRLLPRDFDSGESTPIASAGCCRRRSQVLGPAGRDARAKNARA